MLKSLTSKVLLSSSVAAVAVSTYMAPAEAFQVFTDRAAWEAAVTGTGLTVKTEMFDSTGFNGIGANFVTPQQGITIGNSDNQGQIGGVGYPDVDWLYQKLGYTSETFTLPETTIAFGADLQDIPFFGGPSTLVLQIGSFFTPVFNYGSSFDFTFFGVLAEAGDDPFTTVQFLADGGASSTFYDNLSFASPAATAVPTPALLPGLVGMGIAAFRQRQRQKASQPEA